MSENQVARIMRAHGMKAPEVVRIINLPDVRERFTTLAFSTVGSSRAAFAAYIKSEAARWGKAVRDSGAKAD